MADEHVLREVPYGADDGDHLQESAMEIAALAIGLAGTGYARASYNLARDQDARQQVCEEAEEERRHIAWEAEMEHARAVQQLELRALRRELGFTDLTVDHDDPFPGFY